jgi:hypothetical protein
VGIKESTINFNKWIATMSIADLKVLGFSTKTALLQKTFAGLKIAAMGAANAIASFLPFAIIYGLYELYMALTKASREAERLRKELSDTVSVDVADLDKAIVRYENLANRLGMVNKGSMAHKEIISALNKEYGEYLDFLVNEETTVAQLNAAYDNLVETMRQKQSMEAFQKGMDTIAEHYRTQITEANKTFKDEFGKIGQLELKTTDNNQYLIPTSEEVEHIFNLINQKVRETKDVTSIDDLTEQRDLLNSVIEEFYGKDITLLGADYDNLKFIELMVSRRKEELQLQKEIDAQFEKSLKTREANLKLTELQNKYEDDKLKIADKTTSEFEKQEELAKLKDKFDLDVLYNVKVAFELIGEQEAKEEEDRILKWAEGTIGDINETIKSELGSVFSSEELSKVLFTRELKETKTIANYLKDLKTSWESQNKVIAEQISLKSELGELDANNEKILQDALRKEELYRRTLKLLGVEIQYTERLSEETRIAVNSLEGLPTEMQISLEQAYGGIDNILAGLKKKETEYLNIIRQLNELKKNGLPYDEQRLKIAEETYWWIKKQQDLIDPDSKTAIAEHKVAYINSKLEEKYQLDSIDRTKDEVSLLAEAKTEMEDAIKREKQLNAEKAIGHAITKEELDLAKKETEQTTLKWKLLGGTKDEGGGKGRTNSLYDERIKVIDDMNKKYKELNRTLDKTNSLQGAFDAYKDAFAEAFSGIKWIPKNVQSMSPQEFVAQVLNFPSEDDLVKFLDKLAEEPMKTFEKIKVELAKGKYVYDMKVRAKVEEDEKLIQSIEDMFGAYEISLELKDMNIPSDVAEKLFGLESLDLEGLKTKLEELEPQFIGTDQEKKYRDYLQKVAKMEKEAQQKRLKEYVAFARGAIGERAKVKMEEMQKLEDIEKAFAVKDSDSEETKETKNKWRNEARKKAQEESANALKKLDWEALKSSDTFNMVFDDLERASEESLKNMIDKLTEFRDQWKDMPFDQMRQVVDLLQKAEEAYSSSSSPFAEGRRLKKAIKEDGRSEEQALLDLSSAESELVTIDNIIAKIQLFQQVRDGLANKEMLPAEDMELYNKFLSDSVGFYNQIVDGLSNESMLRTIINNLAYQGKATEENILDLLVKQGKITQDEADKAKKRLTDGQKQAKVYEEQANAIKKMQQMANDLYDSFYDLANNVAEAFGGEISETGKIFAESGQEMMNTVLNTISLQKELQKASATANAFGKALNSAMGIVGWIVMGVQLISRVFSIVTQLHDNKIEKKIQSQIDSVEELEKQYKSLEKTLEHVYSIDTITKFSDDAVNNIDQQIAALDEMIALETEKKNQDEERIKEWYEQREESLEERERLLVEKEKALGGIGGEADYKDASERFVEAWLDAYQETGDGLKGLEEAFDEFFMNMVKKQLVARGVEKMMEPLFKEFDRMFDQDSDGNEKVTKKELDNFQNLWDEALPMMNTTLKSIVEQMGATDEILKSGELGTLQKGIQGITEDQADILASYLNSIRFIIGEHTGYLKTIASNYGDTEVPNPMLGQLQVIANQTSAIHTLLESVTKTGHPQGGFGIKVIM